MLVDLRSIPIIQIRLQERKDFAKCEMARLGLKVLPMEGIRTVPQGIIGCGLSHVKVLRDAPQCPFLVLEDDAAGTEEFRESLEVPESADWVYLGVRKGGVLPDRWTPTDGAARVTPFDENFLRVRSMLGTHAVLYMKPEVVRLAAEQILAGVLRGLGIDTVTAKLQEETLALTPRGGPWFYQSALNGGNELDTRVKFEIRDPVGAVSV